ncbi:MAG: DHHA1 domain-containing protein, partial [Candidatus Kapabacteria bacterium]|nr:DHHA1 domain-containing protein [Candidatus Kapabacteria bacterium]
LKLSDKSKLLSNLIDTAHIINGMKIVSSKVDADNIDELRNIADNLRNQLGSSGIGLLAAETDGKVQIACVATDDVKDKYSAGKLVGLAAKVLGGGGGGKAHLATAGAKDSSKLSELLSNFPDIVKNFNQ